MILSKVYYEFFEVDEPSSTAIELDRQVRLEFADSPVVYVSWTWEHYEGPDFEPYSIGHSHTSYYSDAPAVDVDVSGSPFWAKHIGRDVELTHIPSEVRELEYQVLEIRSGGGCTYLYALGDDCVHISDTSPI